MLDNSSTVVAFTPGGNTILGDQKAIHPAQERLTGKQKIGYRTLAILAEDRRLLDALVSTKHSFNSTQSFSTGHTAKNRNNIQNFEQHQGKEIMAKTHNLNALMTQDIAQNSSDAVNMGRDMYEEEEEEEMLQECRAEAAKRGDL